MRTAVVGLYGNQSLSNPHNKSADNEKLKLQKQR
jgi:hypothetical protein